MASLNKVLLIGNLTRDPEVRYTQSGMAVGKIGMATNREFKTATGEMKKEVTFVNVTVWGRQAETCGEYLRKGSQAFVEGRLKLDEWNDKDGQKRTQLVVVAERVQFLGAPGKRTELGDAPAADVEGRPARKAPAAAPAPGTEDETPPAEGEESEDLPF